MVDVTKAFDSVNHGYLLSCIDRLNLPEWIIKFLRKTIARWRLNIRFNNEEILQKRVERGILQGDSLSPLLFVLYMDPLSRKLNGTYPKVEVKIDKECYASDHLLFIDDLKLFAHNEETLNALIRETENFFKTVGLEMNRQESATNTEDCERSALVLNANEGYKYLGVTENRNSKVTETTFKMLKEKIIGKIKRICKRRLNSKNSVKAINEYALSVINYYVGVLPLDPNHYKEIDDAVRMELCLGFHL